MCFKFNIFVLQLVSNIFYFPKYKCIVDIEFILYMFKSKVSITYKEGTMEYYIFT